MTSSPQVLGAVQRKVWHGRIPLSITLSGAESINPPSGLRTYYVNYPRLSYLPLILPKLHSFFLPYLADQSSLPHDGWFSFEGVPLKWHFPVGLLHDLYFGSSGYSIEDENNGKRPESDATDEEENILPWKIEVHFRDRPEHLLIPLDDEGKALRDAFTNSVKEASFLRTGSGKVVMGLSKEDSTQLWTSVEQNDLQLFSPINQKLLHPPAVPLRHIPLKVYLPATDATEGSTTSSAAASPGHLKVVQALITPTLSSRQAQTLGTALNALLPSLFPSRRSPLLALAVLHGTVLPLGVHLEELSNWASYADGWLHVTVVMMG